MIDLNQLIKDSFDVISLILVFAFVLFELRYPQITGELKRELPPKDRKIEKDDQKEKLKHILLLSNSPLVIIYGFLAYLFLPLSNRVLSESRINLWRFDFIRTAFIFIVLLIIIFLIWSVYLTVKVIIKIIKLR